MRLTPANLAQTYEFLRSHYPFSGWNLPDSGDVKFKTTRNRSVFGDYFYDSNKAEHVIRVSTIKNTHLFTVVKTVAHEMVHLCEETSGNRSVGEHGKSFWTRAEKVCKAFGFDAGEF